MAQNIFPDIVPTITSGNQLATLLNDFKEALMTSASGTTRPSELLEGGTWLDTTNDPIWDLVIYDGTTDIVLMTINTTTGTASITGVDGNFDILKSSDDSVGPTLDMLKKRIAGGGQTQASDILGQINFKGHTSTAVEQLQAQIESLSLDTVTTLLTGGDLRFKTTQMGTNTLSEKMRVTGDGKLGVNRTAPSLTIHSRGVDSTSGIRAERFQDSVDPAEISIRKQRSTGNGPSQSGDKLGKFSVYSTDQNGAAIEVAQIEAEATENHTNTAQGTKLTIRTKANGASSFTDSIVITNGVLQLDADDVSETTAKFWSKKNNLVAVVAPTANDDVTFNYSAGSLWYDSVGNVLYICEDATDGAAVWEVAGGGGRFEMYATESISSGGTISSATNKGFQFRRVQGNAGPQTADTEPFGTGGGWYDGTIIRLMGKHDTNTLTVVYSDTAKGSIINGDVVLGENDFIELQYLTTEDRWFEISRSVF